MSEYYQQELIQLLEERVRKNSNYSLRALSRDMSVDAGDLSRIINGKKKITARIAYKIGVLLELDDKELLAFIKPVLH
jgi:plasmid maintenance system antidote protein VapI